MKRYLVMTRACDDGRSTHAARLLCAMIALHERCWSFGWREFEWRWRTRLDSPLRRLPYALWDGENAAEKTILVHPEGNLADDLMFASCLPDLIASAKACEVRCDSRLVSLFARSFPKAVVRPDTSLDYDGAARALAPCRPDAQVYIGSLPRYFRPTTESFSTAPGYLSADPSLRNSWRRRLASMGSQPKVGLCWRPADNSRPSANAPEGLATWAPVLQNAGVQFVNLVGASGEREAAQIIARHSVTLHSLENVRPNSDIEGYAALLAELDLVITVASRAAHLAGAVGANVWTVLSSCPSWRWGLNGETSVWYPNMRLFRQQHAGDWTWLIRSLTDALGQARL